MRNYPSHIEVADHFYNDSLDLLNRFNYLFNGDSIMFSSIKSRRMKCYVDLRMAMESILKAYTVYYCHADLSGEKLVRQVESYRHHVEKIIAICMEHLPSDELKPCEIFCDKLKDLPVGLRYRLDVMDFINSNESLYYSTIGNDSWIDTLYENIKNLAQYLGVVLSKESKIVSGEELWEIFKQPKYQKYKKKDR